MATAHHPAPYSDSHHLAAPPERRLARSERAVSWFYAAIISMAAAPLSLKLISLSSIEPASLAGVALLLLAVTVTLFVTLRLTRTGLAHEPAPSRRDVAEHPAE